MAATQFLCFGNYLIYQGASSYNINSCEINELFYNLRIDLDKLQYASHITKIINDVTDENQNTYKILQLFLNTLYVLSETDKNMDLTISIFKLKLMCLLGFTPIIDKCTSCKNKDVILNHFSFRDNAEQNRLTRLYQDIVKDNWGKYFYIRDLSYRIFQPVRSLPACLCL